MSPELPDLLDRKKLGKLGVLGRTKGEKTIMTEIIDLFFAYAHADEPLRIELEKHLSMLKRQGFIRDWHDQKILPGQEWEQEAMLHLRSAHIILLLVSPDFLASDYSYGVEFKQAMERHHLGDATVIPVILKPVDWKHDPLDKLWVLPSDEKPVTSWPNQDEGFLSVAEGIREVVEKRRGTSAISLTNEKEEVLFGRSLQKIPIKMADDQDNINSSSSQQTPKMSDLRQASQGSFNAQTSGHFQNFVICNPAQGAKHISKQLLVGKFLFLKMFIVIVVIMFVVSSSTSFQHDKSISNNIGTHLHPNPVAPPVSNVGIGTDPSLTKNDPSMPACPPDGYVRAVALNQHQWGTYPNVVYVKDGLSGSIIIRYDPTNNHKIKIIGLTQEHIINAALSKDGQWILFIASNSERDKFGLVRIDGQDLQTLYCEPTTYMANMLWSYDQKSILIDEEDDQSSFNKIFSLDIEHGTLQLEFSSDGNFLYTPKFWLNNTQVYVRSYQVHTSGGSGLFLLDLNKGTNQIDRNLKRILPDSYCNGADSTPDGELLFVIRCNFDNASVGSISVQPASGGPEKSIFNDQKFSIALLRAISNTTLLVLINNDDSSGNSDANGLWRMNIDGTGLVQLTHDINKSQVFSDNHDKWATVSRDGKMYTLISQNQDGSESLLLGSLNGGASTIFASRPPDPTQEGIVLVGWVTM